MFEYLTKPCKLAELKTLLSKIAKKRQLEKKYQALKRQLSRVEGDPELVGNGPQMVDVKQLIERVAPTDSTVLICGETGTGKELVARAIALSRYIRFDEERNKFDGDPAESFYAVNLAALSPALIESELFGHRRGAFTGAVENRKGWFETCPALGTVFLDEIGELDPSIQVKLLRVIETRTFQPVGDTTSRRFEGKIMAATNRDLADAMRRGTFREDLYYRLCSDQVRTPPLSEQIRESADVLHELIVFTTQRVTGEEDAELARQVEQWVRGNLPPDYPWPGNYRELEQCVRNVLIRRSYEPAGGAAGAGDGRGEADMIERMRRGDLTAEELLRYYITLVYSKTGSYQETARRLALDRRTVKAKITGPAMAKAEKRGTEKVSSPPRWAFKIESRGPIKRSTLELSYPDPEWESLTDVRYWCWCTRLQADRLPRSAFADLQSRDVPSFRRENLSATASYHEHGLMACARNLTRAVKKHSDPSLTKSLPSADFRALELLRNVYEHWDELRAGYRDGHLSGSAKKLATEFPAAEPWSVEFFPDGDVLLANVVSLRSLVKGIRTLEASVRWKLRVLRRQGRHQANKTPPKGPAGTGR